MKTKILLAFVALVIPFLSFAQAGTLDNSFGGDGKVTTVFGAFGSTGKAVAIQADGKIVVAGTQYNSTDHQFEIIRYNSNGKRDRSFGSQGNVTTVIGANSDANAVAIQADGKIVVAGVTYNGSFSSIAVARYNTNGILDSSFSDDGIAITSFDSVFAYGNAIAIQPNGKIVVAGYKGTLDLLKFAVVRYNINGTLDNNFGNNGKVVTGFGGRRAYIFGMALQTNGKIVVAGSVENTASQDFALARYNRNGTIDDDFGNNGKVITDFGGYDEGTAVALQSDGKILVGGTADLGFLRGFALARYRTNGTPDNGFGTNGKVTATFGDYSSEAHAIAIQANDKIVMAGNSYNGSNADFALARFKANGNPDNGFGTEGKVSTNFGGGWDFGYAVTIQQDGKIVVAGHSLRPSSIETFAVARYHANAAAINTDEIDDITSAPLKTPAINVYPNPATDFLSVTVNGNTDKSSLAIINQQGKQLYTQQLDNTKGIAQYNINVKSLPPGLYYLQLMTSAGIKSVKFIKH